MVESYDECEDLTLNPYDINDDPRYVALLKRIEGVPNVFSDSRLVHDVEIYARRQATPEQARFLDTLLNKRNNLFINQTSGYLETSLSKFKAE